MVTNYPHPMAAHEGLRTTAEQRAHWWIRRG